MPQYNWSSKSAVILNGGGYKLGIRAYLESIKSDFSSFETLWGQGHLSFQRGRGVSLNLDEIVWAD